MAGVAGVAGVEEMNIPKELVEIGKKEGFEIEPGIILRFMDECCLYGVTKFDVWIMDLERKMLSLYVPDSAAALLLIGCLSRELHYQNDDDILPRLTAAWLAGEKK